MIRDEELFGTIYEKGEVVFRQGKPGDTMYIIQSGAVEVSQLQGEQKVVLALLDRGDFFGEMALIDKHPRSATVTTISRSRLLPLTRASFLERIRHDPRVALHLLRSFCQRIEKADRLLWKTVKGDETLLSAMESSREKVEERSRQADNNILQDPEGCPRQEEYPLPAMHFYKDQGCICFEDGKTIFHQGEPGDAMYIILEGEVEISQEYGQDRYLLRRLCPGDFFGEIAILTDQPRTATASSTKRTTLLPVKREEFLYRVKAEPELALYILQVLSMRLRTKHSVMKAPEKSMDTVLCVLPPPLKKKSPIRTAIISLSTCGGCPAALLEKQEELMKLLDKVDISYFPMLIDEHHIDEVEVAIVDGAVRIKDDEEKLMEIRNKTRYLVAWGTCASFGGIPAFANQYELEELLEESYGQTLDSFAYYLSGTPGIDRTTYQERELKLLRRVGKLDEFVRVDYYLPGCPPQIRILNQFINELKGEKQDVKPHPIVCTECDRKPVKSPIEYLRVFPRPEWETDHCMTSRGALCMGFITKGGCGAVCPQSGLPCWGCRGPSEPVIKNMLDGYSFEDLMLKSLVTRTKQTGEDVKQLLRIARIRGNSSLNFNQNFITDRSKIR